MKTQNPLIGRSRKSYGDATFYTLNGENIVRTKPMVVSNPNTPAQQAQRVRFGAFTKAANSMPESDLNLLFATKEKGRNRRSILQAQLAPAFGSQPTTDPTAAEKYEPTFDITKIESVGSGSVGYIGELQEVTASQSGLSFTAANLQNLKEKMVLDGSETQMIIVVISEDGCVIKIAGSFTINEVDEAISEGVALSFDTEIEWAEHGNKAYCYAVGGKLKLIGLGTMSVAERPAKKSAPKTHNVPV